MIKTTFWMMSRGPSEAHSSCERKRERARLSAANRKAGNITAKFALLSLQMFNLCLISVMEHNFFMLVAFEKKSGLGSIF